MNVASLVDTVSGAAGAAVVVGAAMRNYWTRRELRHQAAFERAVRQIVDTSIADVVNRQIAFERRQGKHLDRQDRVLTELRLLIEQRTQPPRAHH